MSFDLCVVADGHEEGRYTFHFSLLFEEPFDLAQEMTTQLRYGCLSACVLLYSSQIQNRKRFKDYVLLPHEPHPRSYTHGLTKLLLYVRLPC